MTEEKDFEIINITHSFERQFHQKTFAVPKNIYEQYQAIIGQTNNPFIPKAKYIATILEEQESNYYGDNGLVIIGPDGDILREKDYDKQGQGGVIGYRQYSQNGHLQLADYYGGYNDTMARHWIQSNSIKVKFDSPHNNLDEITFRRIHSNKKENDFKVISGRNAENKTLNKEDLVKLNNELSGLNSSKEGFDNYKSEMHQIINDVRKTYDLALAPKWVSITAYKNL